MLSVTKIFDGMRATIISTTEVATLKLSVVNFNEPGFARTHVTPRVCAAISKRLLLETGSTGCRRRATVNPLNFSLFCRTTTVLYVFLKLFLVIIFHAFSCSNNIFLKVHTTFFFINFQNLKHCSIVFWVIQKIQKYN